MAKHKNKLELTWIGKDKCPKLEPRILLEDPSKTYHAKQRVTDNDIFDNKLIFGDNLLALKALEQEYVGKVKCVFIDPPYNTGSAFEHYDDGIEHSLWLSLIRDRLEIIKNVLADDGSLWITIDDNEAHYLKILCDEVFGRSNFVANCLWQKVYSERMDAKGFSNAHDHILVYQKTDMFKVNQIPKEQNKKQFKFYDEKVEKHYRRRSLRKEGSESLRKDRPSMWYAIEAPDGSEIYPIKPDGTEGRWRWKKENLILRSEELEVIKKDDKWEIYVKQYLEKTATRPPSTWFTNDEVGHTHEAKLEVKVFNAHDIFSTPKPERLLERIIFLATKKDDLVLDSFAGSGTTGAVAQKMGRKWIMVELEETCHTHIIPRLQKVINGEDQGGISKPVSWQGGGGFRYYTLAPSLLEKDKWGNWVVNKNYNGEMLSEAICKLEGFSYAPSDSEWWNHGTSTETDFIYVTTQNLSVEKLQQLSDVVGGDKTLLVCCGSFRCKPNRFANLTIKKIPKMVLSRCEWAHDDYSLNVENLPQMEREPEQNSLFPEEGGES
ncbi:modification methylase DpnIIB [bacterium BMS3Abin11]|nr:modification methylase DpnIIB [bacterium BMS3Abin11]